MPRRWPGFYWDRVSDLGCRVSGRRSLRQLRPEPETRNPEPDPEVHDEHTRSARDQSGRRRIGADRILLAHRSAVVGALVGDARAHRAVAAAARAISGADAAAGCARSPARAGARTGGE